MAITLEQPPATNAPGGALPTMTPEGGPTVSANGGVPALLVEHVTKRFIVGRRKKPVVAIDDVSLRIERGEIYGILGANGSGKSTLIRLVSTLLTLDDGRVEVFGRDIEREEMAVKRLINRVSHRQRTSCTRRASTGSTRARRARTRSGSWHGSGSPRTAWHDRSSR